MERRVREIPFYFKNCRGGKIMYRTAFYVRQSKDNVDNPAQSVKNQQKLLWDFVRNKEEFDVVGIYEDVWSGATFSRPEFLHMVSDINDGKIDCVMVKDLSRLGRNYIETGEHLEQIFPMHHVRFISVNDRFDTNDYSNGESMIIALKNILNDLQLRMLSQNIRKTTYIKMKRGDYPSGGGPYGYMRSKVNPAQLIVDWNTAPVVKKIFQMKLDGASTLGIAKELTRLEIPTPMQYWRSIGRLKSDNRGTSDSKWSHITVNDILRNPYYTGNCVNGRYKRDKINEKSRKTDVSYSSEWIITPNTHEAIIDEEMFKSVQKILEKSTEKRRASVAANPTKQNPFPDIVCCAVCGKKLIRKKVRDHYLFRCDHVHITETDLSDLTVAALNNYLRRVHRRTYVPKDSLPVSSISDSEYKKEKIQLYENYKNGDISKKGYLQEKLKLDEKIERIKEEEKQKRVGMEASSLCKPSQNLPEKDVLSSIIKKISIEDANNVEFIFYPLPGTNMDFNSHWSMQRKPTLS